jgi:hypothetical protein
MNPLRRRLQRLERSASVHSGRCPDCPPITFVTKDADGHLVEGEYPKHCRSCGGPHDGRPRYVAVVVLRADLS